jgi:hypothetical protein
VQITPAGRKALQAEIANLKRLIEQLDAPLV